MDKSATSSLKPRERNIGIELLRILSILFVVTLHVMGQGGVLGKAGVDVHSPNNVAAVVIELSAYGAVTLFALISGYVALRSKWALKKWLRMWTMIVFWGLVMTFLVDKTILFDGFNGILKCLIPGVRQDYADYVVGKSDYINALFPLCSKQYWYFNMYTLLLLLMPLLNTAIAALEKRKLALICTALVFFTSVYGAVSVYRSQGDTDLFGVTGGFTAMWLVVMYLTGACIRRYHEDGFKPKKWLCFLGYILSVALATGWFFLTTKWIDKDPQNSVLYIRRGIVYSYTSPFTVIGALCLLLLFMQIKVKRKRARKLIVTLSGSSFAVYIIHTQLVVWQYFMPYRFTEVAAEPTGIMILQVLAAVLSIYFVCTIMEILRKTLFEVTCLDKGIDRIGDAVDNKLKRFVYGKKEE